MIGEQETDAFRRMSGGINDFQRQITDFDFIAMFQTFVRKLILPVRAALIGKIQLCSCNFCQFAGTRKKIGVNMRFGNMGYGKVVFFSNLQIGIYITLRVDYNRFTFCLTAD